MPTKLLIKIISIMDKPYKMVPNKVVCDALEYEIFTWLVFLEKLIHHQQF